MKSSNMSRLIAILLCLMYLHARPVFAYRPFDSTDANVAARGEIEIECGPVGYLVEMDGRFVVVPALIVNVGVGAGWEIVLEGKNFVHLNAVEDVRRLKDAALSVKKVLRRGTLQDRSGPSVAVEAGLLLPTADGLGSSVNAIVSQGWSAMTLHVNGGILFTRGHDVSGAVGAIAEGPQRWRIRPVAELTVEKGVDQTVSALAGTIWQVSERLSLDAGWRIARTDSGRVHDFRAGFTWAFPIGWHVASQRLALSKPPQWSARA